MSSIIVNQIQPRAFELIRDRIFVVLSEEMVQQATFTSELTGINMFKERFIPFQASDMPAINVALTRGNFDNFTALKKDGHYSFNIDVYTRAKTTDASVGDTASAVFMQRILGVCNAILSDVKYNTLGFDKPFISRVHVDEIQIAEPQRNNDAESIIQGRLTFIVRVPENVETLIANVIDGMDTQVLMSETQLGYVFTGEGSLVPPPTCDPGEVFNSNALKLGDAPSGGSFVVDDSVLTMNGGAFLDVAATEPFNVIVKNDLGAPIGTVISGEIIIPSTSDQWVRNGNWMPIPTVSPGDRVLYGIYAVYEGIYNPLTMEFGGGADSIDWGDGTSESTVLNLVTYNKDYDYASLSGVVTVDDYGRNYKNVLVSVPFGASGGTSVNIDRNNFSNGSNGWLDLSIDSPLMATLFVTKERRAQNLERLRVYSHNIGGVNSAFQYMTNLKVMKLDLVNAGNNAAAFHGLGNIRDENNNPFDWNWALSTTASSIFTGSILTKVGDVSFPLIGAPVSVFSNMDTLQSVGDIDLPSATSMSSFFTNCFSLIVVGDITTSSSLTSLASFASACRRLTGISISDCSGVTATSNMFLTNSSMDSVILTGITVGFILSNANMNTAALDAMFTALGTASGSQTIMVSGNPGSSTCDTSIATNKGFTVVI